jgi:hypothetical protein
VTQTVIVCGTQKGVVPSETPDRFLCPKLTKRDAVKIASALREVGCFRLKTDGSKLAVFFRICFAPVSGRRPEPSIDRALRRYLPTLGRLVSRARAST